MTSHKFLDPLPPSPHFGQIYSTKITQPPLLRHDLDNPPPPLSCIYGWSLSPFYTFAEFITAGNLSLLSLASKEGCHASIYWLYLSSCAKHSHQHGSSHNASLTLPSVVRHKLNSFENACSLNDGNDRWRGHVHEKSAAALMDWSYLIYRRHHS